MLDQPYLDAIKGFEGYSPQAQWDYKQNSSGYGTRSQPGDENLPPDQLKAIHEQRLHDEVGKAEASVDAFAPGLPSGTRAALVSLTYNAGPGWQQSGLGQAVKGGDLDKAKDIFLQYNKAGGEVNPGLVNRRQAEAAWFGGSAPQSQPQAPQAAPQAPLTLPSATQPVFPQPPPQAPQAGPGGQQTAPQFEMPQGPPIFYAQRRAPDLSGLQQALASRGSPYFKKG